MKYKVNRIRSDVYRLYPIGWQRGVYAVKAIGTIIPRLNEGLYESIKLMHRLIEYKRELLSGAFINQTRRNHPRKIWIRGMKKFRIKYLSVRCMDQMQPNWRIYDVEDHRTICFLNSSREALLLLHEYFDRG